MHFQWDWVENFMVYQIFQSRELLFNFPLYLANPTVEVTLIAIGTFKFSDNSGIFGDYCVVFTWISSRLIVHARLPTLKDFLSTHLSFNSYKLRNVWRHLLEGLLKNCLRGSSFALGIFSRRFSWWRTVLQFTCMSFEGLPYTSLWRRSF